MPIFTSGIRYPPVGPVVAAYSEEVSTPFATTCALATIAPVESSTVPAMAPRSDCERALVAVARINKVRAKNLVRWKNRNGTVAKRTDCICLPPAQLHRKRVTLLAHRYSRRDQRTERANGKPLFRCGGTMAVAATGRFKTNDCSARAPNNPQTVGTLGLSQYIVVKQKVF